MALIEGDIGIDPFEMGRTAYPPPAQLGGFAGWRYLASPSSNSIFHAKPTTASLFPRQSPRAYEVGKAGNHKASAMRVTSNTGGVINRPILMYCPQPIL